jgi:hypothetical protein
MRILAAALPLALLAACDARATTAAAPARADLKSREHESCAATIDCQDGLRCFERACRRTNRSTLGDFHAALAAQQHRAGQHDAAYATYAEAVSRYGSENLEVPAEIECAYGRALLAGKSNPERAELAARKAHRCYWTSPAGGPLRAEALAVFAGLYDAGLDPAHVASEKAADKFLTRAAAAPDTARLAVGVVADPTPTGKSWPAVSARLSGADLKGPLVACWEKYYAAAHKPALAVSFGLKSRFVENPDYEDEGRWTVSLEPAQALGGPEAAADACVRAVVEPVMKKAEGVRDSFQTRVTLTIQ